MFHQFFVPNGLILNKNAPGNCLCACSLKIWIVIDDHYGHLENYFWGKYCAFGSGQFKFNMSP